MQDRYRCEACGYEFGPEEFADWTSFECPNCGGIRSVKVDDQEQLKKELKPTDNLEAAYRGLLLRVQSHQDGWVVNIIDQDEAVVARTVLTPDRNIAEAEAKKLADEYVNSKINSK
jgi:DNA-directed RNA polymerase subunit RPC12/RpoP